MTNQPRIYTNFSSFSNPTPDLYFRTNVQSETTYTSLASDLGCTTILTNVAAVAVTLGTPSNTEPASSYGTGGGANVPTLFCKGWFTEYLRLGVGVATLTPASGTINGAASLTLNNGEGAKIITDGTNYFAMVYHTGSGGVSSCNALTGTVTFTSSGSTVAITNPSGSVINLESSASAPTWSTWTPTISANAGTFTSVSATGRYSTVGKIVFVAFKVNIVTNGTASSYIKATLPSTPAAHGNIIHGKEIAINGKAQQAEVVSSSTTMILSQYDGGYAGADGAVLEYSGFYEIP